MGSGDVVVVVESVEPAESMTKLGLMKVSESES